MHGTYAPEDVFAFFFPTSSILGHEAPSFLFSSIPPIIPQLKTGSSDSCKEQNLHTAFEIQHLYQPTHKYFS